jgi:Fe/S biogenesis protein NfuA
MWTIVKLGLMENQTDLEFSIEVTETAREKVLDALKGQEGKTALRLEAKSNGTTQFSYSMRLISDEEKTAEDVVVDVGGLDIVVDSGSAKNLNGASIEWEDRVVRSGFKFNNPNKPEVPEIGDGAREDLTGSTVEKVQKLLETELNPAVASHGGRINLVGVKDNKVYLTFGGGCHGCGMVDMTLKHGVEKRIKEVIPEIEEVIDSTDHSVGQNPFYS